MLLNQRIWVDQAVKKIEADYLRSADTHLVPIQLPAPLSHPNIDIYLKDESTHPKKKGYFVSTVYLPYLNLTH